MNRSIIFLLLSTFLLAQSFECDKLSSHWNETCKSANRQYNSSDLVEAVKGCDVALNCARNLAPCDPMLTPNYIAGIEAACRSLEFANYEFIDCWEKIEVSANDLDCVNEHFDKMSLFDTVKPAKCEFMRNNNGCVRKMVKKYCDTKDVVAWQKHADDQFYTLNC